jgi:hypothetical protein
MKKSSIKSLKRKKIDKILFFLIVFLNLFLSSWYFLHGDLDFSADIARDFHLFREIDQKKIILIGPRSSVSGLFHGPLWLYLNYPAYSMGKGNPIIVGWYWVFLTILFLILSFLISKNLFGELTAYFYTLHLSLYAIFHTKSLFNPHGVYFLLPLFYFLLVKYTETNKLSYLILHLVTGGLLIQFELAIGIPYVVISSFIILFYILKRKNILHIFSFLVVPLCLINFIVFNFRHDSILWKGIKYFLLAHTRPNHPSYLAIIKDNLRLIFSGIEILRANPISVPFDLRIPPTLIFSLFLYLQIKQNIHRKKYIIFLFLFLGYFVLSLINRGFILYFYLFPQFSLVFLIFASLVTSKYKRCFIALFLLVFISNFLTAIKDTINSKNFIGKDLNSWKFLIQLSEKVYQQPEDSFGYFVFSPDLFGYQPKYAMIYASTLFRKQVYSFKKKPITYIIAAPHQFIQDEWWRKNQLFINQDPVMVIKFDNGYKIEKYILTEEQTKIPFDPNIDLGINFR